MVEILDDEKSPSHTVGLERSVCTFPQDREADVTIPRGGLGTIEKALELPMQKNMSPSHTVGLELGLDEETINYLIAGVTIPHGGLRTETGRRRSNVRRGTSPSHTVGLEHGIGEGKPPLTWGVTIPHGGLRT